MLDARYRSPNAHPRIAEAALFVTLFACSFPGSMITIPSDDLDVSWWPSVVLTGLGCAALAGRQRRPRATVALTALGAVVVTALGYIPTVLLLGPLVVALHSLAATAPRRVAYGHALCVIALISATGLLFGPGEVPPLLRLIGPTAWLLLPTALGSARRYHLAYLALVEAHAEHAERRREEEARLRVAEERLRIARDLHDVVAHHMVLAHLQARTVSRLVRTRPEEAGRVSADLAGTATLALDELKATVGLLRDPGTVPDEQDGPGLDRLADLAASFRSAGLTVTVVTEGEPLPVHAPIGLAVYRIVQEALTNVTKHADTARAEVRLAFAQGHLRLTVADSGTRRPAGPTTTGYGLLGMHERARSVGGRLRAGHRPEGGFEVVSDLPLPYPDAADAA
ncbi:sensor histidine kinase [Streptomyces sp. 4F14]|uniref:sensor histidine kinase n=1 Tax=Streptomyces sp. 4F14 TaxID=3394380 RepID=UPI003A8C3153